MYVSVCFYILKVKKVWVTNGSSSLHGTRGLSAYAPPCPKHDRNTSTIATPVHAPQAPSCTSFSTILLNTSVHGTNCTA